MNKITFLLTIRLEYLTHIQEAEYLKKNGK